MNFVNPCMDNPPQVDSPPPGPNLQGQFQAVNVVVGHGAMISVWYSGTPGHVDWLQAVLPPAAVGQGAVPTQAVRNGLAPFRRQGDDAGHIIAANLGGPGNQLWNFFAQSPNINRGVWGQQEQMCANALRANQPVRLCFRFHYGDPNYPNRPTSFDYCYKLAIGILNNNLVNP